MTTTQIPNETQGIVQIQDKIAEKRSQIDAEICILRERIRVLSTTRNALAPVASLPSEILTKIFGLSQIVFYEELDKEQVNGKILLTTIAVCRRWRLIALDSPLLWAEINYTNKKWAMECLERSKKAYLKVGSLGTFGWPKDFYQALLRELPRVQCLAITSSRHGYAADPKNWTGPMHSLHNLKLYNYLIPENLYSLQLPALRSLELEQCEFSQALPSFSSLTKLAIKSPIGLKMSALLDGLSSATTLLDLELSQLEPVSVDHWNTSDLPHIRLLTLSTLVIKFSTLLATIQFIRHTSVPSTARGTVTCQLPKEEEGVFPDFMRDFRWRESDTIGSINFGSEWLPPRREIQMMYWQKEGIEWVEGGGFLDLAITFDSPASNILRLLRHIPMNDLEILLVHFQLRSGLPISWNDVFASLPNLKEVHASLRAATAFMEDFLSANKAVFENNINQPHHPAPLLPFPALEILRLKERRLFDSNFEKFCKVLESRNSFGSRLKRLVIHREPDHGVGVDFEKLKLLVDEIAFEGA